MNKITFKEFEERLAKWRNDINMTPETTTAAKQMEKFEEERREACKELVDCLVCLINAEAMGDELAEIQALFITNSITELFSDIYDDVLQEVIEKLESRVGSGKWIDGKYVKKEDLEDDEGWIDWGGDCCHVNADTEVDVKLRCGSFDTGLAGDYGWNHYDCGGDIIKYRIHKDS